jgi:hypothetical protein
MVAGLFFKGLELSRHKDLTYYGIDDRAVLHADVLTVGSAPFLKLFANSPCDPACQKLIAQTASLLHSGIAPRLALDGTGGAYFIGTNSKSTIAVFKPADEEQFAPNNPRGVHIGHMGQTGLRKGIPSGQGCLREGAFHSFLCCCVELLLIVAVSVAAYLLDHKSCARVPATARVEMLHPVFHYNDHTAKKGPKCGSLQAFVSANGSSDDFAARLFPARDVHRIALFDMRVLNCDRNDANILVQKLGSQFQLIPIDHGYALPSVLEICPIDWVWYDWPQLEQEIDPAVRDYILALDVEADAAMLQQTLGFNDESLYLMRVSHRLVQCGVRANLNLKQIASLICRFVPTMLLNFCTYFLFDCDMCVRSTDEGQPSVLELLLHEADRIANITCGDDNDSGVLSDIESNQSFLSESSDDEIDDDDSFEFGDDPFEDTVVGSPSEGFSSAFRARQGSKHEHSKVEPTKPKHTRRLTAADPETSSRLTLLLQSRSTDEFSQTLTKVCDFHQFISLLLKHLSGIFAGPGTQIIKPVL